MIKIDIKERLFRFLEEYGSYYSLSQIDNLRGNLVNYVYKRNYKNELFDEVAASIGVLDPKDNYYLSFYKMIGEIYGYDLNILEIGAGIFPILSKYIDDEQSRIGKGKITAIDPLVIDKKIGNIKLVRDEFKSGMDISDFDLIIAIRPCSATDMIVREAELASKNLFLALCSCQPYQMYDFDTDMYRDEWINMEKYVMSRQKDNGFDVGIHDSLPNFPNPVMYTKKK